MLNNLTARNDFKTRTEREAKWGNRHFHPKSAHSEKKFPYKFNEIFKATDYNGIYYSDCLVFSYINKYCKQRTFIDSVKYWKTRPSTRFRRLFPAEFADHENNIEFHGIADNLDQIVEFYNDGHFFVGNHVILCHTVKKNPNEPHSGWKWHKHEKYIGIRNHQNEYLNDEPEIDEVIEFSIYKVI